MCIRDSAWGALSVILPYFIHKPVEDLLEHLSPFMTALIGCVVSVYFVTDVVSSVKTALGIAKLLEEVDKMRAEADALREQLTAQAEKTRQQLMQAAQEMRAQSAAAVSYTHLLAVVVRDCRAQRLLSQHRTCLLYTSRCV